MSFTRKWTTANTKTPKHQRELSISKSNIDQQECLLTSISLRLKKLFKNQLKTPRWKCGQSIRVVINQNAGSSLFFSQLTTTTNTITRIFTFASCSRVWSLNFGVPGRAAASVSAIFSSDTFANTTGVFEVARSNGACYFNRCSCMIWLKLFFLLQKPGPVDCLLFLWS